MNCKTLNFYLLFLYLYLNYRIIKVCSNYFSTKVNNKVKLFIFLYLIFQTIRITYYCIFNKTKDLSIKFNDEGEPINGIIMMIHGFPVNEDIWIDYKKYFLNKKYKVITFNLPLFSNKEFNYNDKIAYRKEDIQRTIFNYLVSKDYNNVSILSVGLGSVMAIDYIKNYPKRINKIITLDVGYFNNNIKLSIFKYLLIYQWILILLYLLYHSLYLNKLNINFFNSDYLDKKLNYNFSVKDISFPRNAYIYIQVQWNKYNLKYDPDCKIKKLLIYSNCNHYTFHQNIKHKNLNKKMIEGDVTSFFGKELKKTVKYIDEFLENN